MGIDVQSIRHAELGNSAHLLLERDSGLALLVDPARDVGPYLSAVHAAGVRLSWALETHVHNDFVSGGRELVAETGAKLGGSRAAGLRYSYEQLVDGDEIELGAWRVRVLATPGHTPEHIAYLVLDPAGEPVALFSGGALMVGTAARTDLFGPALAWRFAHDLERTLKDKVLSLPDLVAVYPTHGGGSFCAAGAGSALSTTIGAERGSNPLLLAGGSRQFVARALTAGPYPSYYNRMRALNQQGAPLLGPRLPAPPGLGVAQVDTWLAQGALLLDVRPGAEYRAGHVPGSLAVGADGNVSGWVGWLVGPERPLVLIAGEADEGAAQVEEAHRQLLRIGYDRVVGVLRGGVAGWGEAHRELTSYRTWRADELAARLDADEALTVVDVREAAEWHAGHIPGSVNVPVHDIPTTTLGIPSVLPVAVHCGHDYRGTLGASLLERAGYRDLTVIEDGWDGWSALEGGQP